MEKQILSAVCHEANTRFGGTGGLIAVVVKIPSQQLARGRVPERDISPGGSQYLPIGTEGGIGDRLAGAEAGRAHAHQRARRQGIAKTIGLGILRSAGGTGKKP